MQPWNLRLFGKFELTSPDGTQSVLPTRKAEALIAILSLNRKHGVSREELASILWPTATPEKQRDSFRQALSMVRRVLGEDSIESTRDRCRLADRIEIRSDFDDRKLRANTAFMPDFTGPWFDSIRLAECVETEIEPVTAPNPVSSFLNLLEWYAGRNSSKTVALMRENLNLTVGIDCDTLSALLEKCGPTSEHDAWKRYFEGFLMMRRGSVALGRRKMHGVIVEAECLNDTYLGIQAASQYCAAACFQNKLDEAMQASRWATAIAEGSRTRRLTATATHLRGWVLIFAGEVRKGAAILAKAEDLYDDPLDVAEMRAYQALFLTAVGDSDQSERLIQSPSKIADECGHRFLQAVCSLTKAVNRLNEGRAEDAVSDLERAILMAESYDNNHLVIPAREFLALAYRRSREHELARGQMARARMLRQSMSSTYTPLDRLRLEPELMGV